jgi:hypothetical protein
MHGHINVISPNNTSKWQVGFNSAFKGLIFKVFLALHMRGNNIKIINIRTHFKTTEWQGANWIEEAQYGA